MTAMIIGTSTPGIAHRPEEPVVIAYINKIRAAVNIETPIKSRPFIFVFFGFISYSWSSSPGISFAPMSATGAATSAVNQNTQDQDAYWTMIAPMKRPRTMSLG